MPKKDLLELDSRREIYDFIKRSPGTHLRGIEREVKLPFGQVLYHLDSLEKHGLVSAKKDGGFKRYFVKHLVGRHEKDYLANLRHDLPRHVAILLLLAPDLSHHEILDYFDVSPSTLSFHLNKMVEAGIVVRREAGNENFYRVADERIAAKVLVLYRESYQDPVVDRFADLWLSVNFLPRDARALVERADRDLQSRFKGDVTPENLALSVLHG
jgi:DNA-binding transcriptional ArsR family regulator